MGNSPNDLFETIDNSMVFFIALIKTVYMGKLTYINVEI